MNLSLFLISLARLNDFVLFNLGTFGLGFLFFSSWYFLISVSCIMNLASCISLSSSPSWLQLSATQPFDFAQGRELVERQMDFLRSRQFIIQEYSRVSWEDESPFYL